MIERQPFKQLLCALLLALALASCTGDDDGFQAVNGTDTQPTATNDGANADGQGIGLDIFEGPGGSVIVFVPVYIQGEGPFDFILDTGASRTVVDISVADQFDLPQTSAPSDVTGVGGTAEADLIEIDDWSLGPDVALPPLQVTTFPVFEDRAAAQIEDQLGREIQGLLGSDALTHFGVITIDFEQSHLVVGR